MNCMRNYIGTHVRTQVGTHSKNVNLHPAYLDMQFLCHRKVTAHLDQENKEY